MKTLNPVKDIIDYFGVTDLKEIVNTERFTAICPPDSISFHVNTEESGMTYLWFEDEKGFTGYGLDNGELLPYKSRASHFLDGHNGLKQRHASLRDLMRASRKEKDKLRKSNAEILQALKNLVDRIENIQGLTFWRAEFSEKDSEEMLKEARAIIDAN